MPSVTPTSAASLLSPEMLAQLDRLELISRRIFRGRLKGERRSPRKGQSVEFADFRNYVPGDDLRFLDWNLYARLDRLFLKMFLEEEDLHFYTLVDDSRSMGFGDPTKLRFAQQLAAALGYIGLVRSDRVCIDRLSQPLAERSPRWRGRQSLWRMQEHVAAIEAEPAGSLAEGVKHFCLRNTGKGILVLITDLMDKQGYAPAMRMLLSQQMDVYVIHVLSPEEIDPDVQGDLRLIDCEDQDAAEITVSAPLLRRYKQTLDAFVDGARDFCSKRGMAYVLARSDMPVEDLVMRYLRRRGLVR